VRDIATTLHAPEAEVRRLLKLAARMGRVDEVALDHFFLRMTMAEIVAIAEQLQSAAPASSFSAADLRDQLGSGRKVAIQILEFLDRHGVTLRRDDLRRVNPLRRDLFGESAVGKGRVPGGASGLQIREGP
jgi:selenocysteine-specific elongation factor